MSSVGEHQPGSIAKGKLDRLPRLFGSEKEEENSTKAEASRLQSLSLAAPTVEKVQERRKRGKRGKKKKKPMAPSTRKLLHDRPSLKDSSGMWTIHAFRLLKVLPRMRDSIPVLRPIAMICDPVQNIFLSKLGAVQSLIVAALTRRRRCPTRPIGPPSTVSAASTAAVRPRR